MLARNKGLGGSQDYGKVVGWSNHLDIRHGEEGTEGACVEYTDKLKRTFPSKIPNAFPRPEQEE